jgi:hypothetical protein
MTPIDAYIARHDRQVARLRLNLLCLGLIGLTVWAWLGMPQP